MDSSLAEYVQTNVAPSDSPYASPIEPVVFKPLSSLILIGNSCLRCVQSHLSSTANAFNFATPSSTLPLNDFPSSFPPRPINRTHPLLGEASSPWRSPIPHPTLCSPASPTFIANFARFDQRRSRASRRSPWRAAENLLRSSRRVPSAELTGNLPI